MPAALECTAWNVMIWSCVRLTAPRVCPVPMSQLAGHGHSLQSTTWWRWFSACASCLSCAPSVEIHVAIY